MHLRTLQGVLIYFSVFATHQLNSTRRISFRASLEKSNENTNHEHTSCVSLYICVCVDQLIPFDYKSELESWPRIDNFLFVLNVICISLTDRMLFNYLFVSSFLSTFCPAHHPITNELGPGPGLCPGLCFILVLSRAPTRGQHLLQFLASNTRNRCEVWQRLTHSACKMYTHMLASFMDAA